VAFVINNQTNATAATGNHNMVRLFLFGGTTFVPKDQQPQGWYGFQDGNHRSCNTVRATNRQGMAKIPARIIFHMGVLSCWLLLASFLSLVSVRESKMTEMKV
jgi:hypothetical protein